MWHNGRVHPVLLQAFGVTLYAYAVATVVGYVQGVLVGVWFARKDGRAWRDIVDMCIVACLGGVLGAKVFHTLFEAKGHRLHDGTIATSVWQLLADDPWHWARLFEPGYVFYGGAIFGIGLSYVLTLRRGLPEPLRFGDYAVAPFGLGIFIGRLGCFLAGCCHGAPSSLPWAVTFPLPHPSQGAAIHPVQLYDAAYGLLLFLFALWFWPRRRFGGQLFILMLASYSVFRFLTEAVRADAERGVWGPLSTSQIVSLLVLPLSAGLWWFMTKRHARGLLRPTNLPFTDDDDGVERAPDAPAPSETPA